MKSLKIPKRLCLGSSLQTWGRLECERRTKLTRAFFSQMNMLSMILNSDDTKANTILQLISSSQIPGYPAFIIIKQHKYSYDPAIMAFTSYEKACFSLQCITALLIGLGSFVALLSWLWPREPPKKIADKESAPEAAEPQPAQQGPCSDKCREAKRALQEEHVKTCVENHRLVEENGTLKLQNKRLWRENEKLRRLHAQVSSINLESSHQRRVVRMRFMICMRISTRLSSALASYENAMRILEEIQAHRMLLRHYG